jgi:hypothetical protein
LLRQRPDIFQAEQQLVAADHTLDAAWAALMPAAHRPQRRCGRLQPAAGSAVDLLRRWQPPAPLLDGGRLRAQADATAARRDEAAYAYQKAVLVAWRDGRALAAARGAQAQQQAVQEQEVALREALAMSRKRYRAGYSPYLNSWMRSAACSRRNCWKCRPAPIASAPWSAWPRPSVVAGSRTRPGSAPAGQRQPATPMSEH